MKLSDYKAATKKLNKFIRWSRKNRGYIPPKDPFKGLRESCQRMAAGLNVAFSNAAEAFKKIGAKGNVWRHYGRTDLTVSVKSITRGRFMASTQESKIIFAYDQYTKGKKVSIFFYDDHGIMSDEMVMDQRELERIVEFLRSAK